MRDIYRAWMEVQRYRISWGSSNRSNRRKCISSSACVKYPAHRDIRRDAESLPLIGKKWSTFSSRSLLVKFFFLLSHRSHLSNLIAVASFPHLYSRGGRCSFGSMCRNVSPLVLNSEKNAVNLAPTREKIEIVKNRFYEIFMDF